MRPPDEEPQLLLARRAGGLLPLRREELLSAASMARAMDLLRQVFALEGTPALAAPPRETVTLGGRRLTFTLGALARDGAPPLYGFRVYCRSPGVPAPDDDVTLLYDAEDRLAGLYVGNALAELRTGAIGGLAIDAAAPRDARVCTVIGCGNQARAQALAAWAARPSLARIHVHCRTRERRERFAAGLRDALGCEVAAADDLAAAVRESDIVVAATSSEAPVIEASWLGPRVHVNAVGPKFEDGAELPRAVFEGAALVFTDSLQQYRANRGVRAARRVLPLDEPKLACLSDLLRDAGPRHAADADGRTVFFSQGLASTELAVLDALLLKHFNPEHIKPGRGEQ